MTVSAKQTCKFIIAISTKKSNDTDITPYRCSHVIHYAADRNRTGTGITTHRILSPGRLPVPPLRRIPFGKWMEVDSNHRSNMQQIYSLSPLATRESIHIVINFQTRYYYISFFSKCKLFF